MNQLSNNYNLEERTAKFGENIIKFCRDIRQDVITRPIINQNDNAKFKKHFIKKINYLITDYEL